MAVDFKFPDVGEGIHEGELIRWLVKQGDKVKEHQPIAEVETDKAVVEIPSPVAGTILKLHASAGQTIKVGEVIATIGKAGEKVKSKGVSIVGEIKTSEELLPPPKMEVIKPSKETKALPAVRKLAAEHKIDISSIKGTGAGGRITQEDVLAVVGEIGPKVTFDEYGKIIRIPLKGIRKTIAKNMAQAWSTAVHVTHMDEADVTELVKVRTKEKKSAEKKGIYLTYLPYVVKVVVRGLRQYRYLNSSMEDETIVTKQYFNIGIAVDTPDGLIVPVVKNCDQKSLLEIAKEMRELSNKARERTIDLHDLQGGSFSITNIGSIGGLAFTPIINYPQAAILGLGRMYDKPLVVGNKIAIRKVMPLVLSFDHRIVDGAAAAKFMNLLIEQLESPDKIIRTAEKGLTQD